MLITILLSMALIGSIIVHLAWGILGYQASIDIDDCKNCKATQFHQKGVCLACKKGE